MMTIKDFLSHCEARGGDWTGMIGSGIKALWPDDYAALPDTFSFKQVLDILTKHGVDMSGD